jgi:hypothetical protein
MRSIQFLERPPALLLRFFLLAQETTQRVLQVRFLLLAIRLIPLIALDGLEQGVLKISSNRATYGRTEHRVRGLARNQKRQTFALG